MSPEMQETLLGLVDSFGTLVLLLVVIWAIGAKRLVPGWVYEECHAEVERLRARETTP